MAKRMNAGRYVHFLRVALLEFDLTRDLAHLLHRVDHFQDEPRVAIENSLDALDFSLAVQVDVKGAERQESMRRVLVRLIRE